MSSSKRNTIMGHSIATLRTRDRFVWIKNQNDIFRKYIYDNEIKKKDIRTLDLNSLYRSLRFDIFYDVSNDEDI